jgi:hypothetical protein
MCYGVATCTGLITTSQLVKTGYGILTRIKIVTDGTNLGTVTIYDNTVASGKIIDKTPVPGASYYGGGNITVPVSYMNGLYVEITGTGAGVIIDHI